MTKKDYQLIASCLDVMNPTHKWFTSEERAKASFSYWQSIATQFANDLGSKDPKFNRNKFLELCGIETKPVQHLEVTDRYKKIHSLED